jgi:hypothetical protein
MALARARLGLAIDGKPGPRPRAALARFPRAPQAERQPNSLAASRKAWMGAGLRMLRHW